MDVKILVGKRVKELRNKLILLFKRRGSELCFKKERKFMKR